MKVVDGGGDEGEGDEVENNESDDYEVVVEGDDVEGEGGDEGDEGMQKVWRSREPRSSSSLDVGPFYLKAAVEVTCCVIGYDDDKHLACLDSWWWLVLTYGPSLKPGPRKAQVRWWLVNTKKGEYKVEQI